MNNRRYTVVPRPQPLTNFQPCIHSYSYINHTNSISQLNFVLISKSQSNTVMPSMVLDYSNSEHITTVTISHFLPTKKSHNISKIAKISVWNTEVWYPRETAR